MSSFTEEYRLRIRNATNSGDVLVITSVRGDATPFLQAPPSGDGASFDPLTGQAMCASYTGTIVDAITSGVSRIVTAQLEDANQRPQLGYRVAFVESRINGGAWTTLVAGYLTLLRLTSAVTWEYTVQDASRVQGGFETFGALGNTLMTTFLALWPNRGCAFGGPVIGGFLGMKDSLGKGWTMKVHRLGFAGSYVYYFEYLSGYGPPNWLTSKNINDFADGVNASVKGLFQAPRNDGHLSSFATINDSLQNSFWSGLIFLVSTADSSTPIVYRPTRNTVASAGAGFPLAYDQSNPNALVVSGGIDKNNTYKGVFTIQDGQAALNDGDIVTVRALTILPTDLSPIYVDQHPADFLATVWTQAGIPFYPTAITNLKNTLGTKERVARRITQTEQIGSLIQETVFAPYGVAVRVGTIGDAASNGLLVPFPTRKLPTALPSVTITDQDVVQDETKLPYELDASAGVNTLILKQKILQTILTGADDKVLDGVTEGDSTITEFNTDPNAVPSGTVTIDVPGMLHQDQSWSPNQIGWLDATAKTLFDRFGRGNIKLETSLIRGGAGDALNLGDEALIDIAQLPNHNVRLGDSPSTPARRMQLISVTELPQLRQARFSDSGPNANQLATVPTLSIVLAIDLPRSIALVTITNAATLNAAGIGLRLQAAAIAGGPAPLAADYVDIAAFADGLIPTTAFRIGPYIAGQTLYVRARSEKKGSAASNYGASANVTLSAVANPTSLVATPSGADGSLCTLTWAPGAGTANDVVDVYLRTSGQPFSLAQRIDTLPPGSNRYTIQLLTAGVSYIATVQYRDPNTLDQSDAIDVVFIAGGVTRVLAAPVDQTPFSGSVDPETGSPLRDGVFGLAVLAAEFPGQVEFAIATETGVASGFYGAFVTVDAPVPSVLGNWTKFSTIAPNDGLRRQLQARHVQAGATSSAYTPTVVATPWTPSALPPVSTLSPIVEVTFLPPTAPGVNVRLQVNGVDPIGTTMQVAIKSTGSATGIITGPGVGILSPNATIWEISQPQPAQGPGSLVVQGVTTDGRIAELAVTIPEASTVAAPQGTVAFTADGNWQATADGPSNAKSFKFLSSTGAFPSDSLVLSSGSVVTGPVRTFSTSGGPLSIGQAIFLTIIPFTQPSAGGVALPSIHIQGAYLNLTGSKTVNYSAGSYLQIDGTDSITFNTNTLPTSPDLGIGSPLKLSMHHLLPTGVSIAQVSMWGTFGAQAGSNVGVYVNRFFRQVTGGVTSQLGSGSLTYNGGQQTTTMIMAETVGSSSGYTSRVDWTGAMDAGQTIGGGVAITYFMPDSKKTL